MKEKIIDTFLIALTIAIFLFVIFSMVCAVYDAFMFNHMHQELHEVRDMLQTLNDSIYW